MCVTSSPEICWSCSLDLINVSSSCSSFCFYKWANMSTIHLGWSLDIAYALNLPTFMKTSHAINAFHDITSRTEITSFRKHKNNIITRCCLCTNQTFPTVPTTVSFNMCVLAFCWSSESQTSRYINSEYTLLNTTNIYKIKCFYFPRPLMKVCFSPQRCHHSPLSHKEYLLPFPQPTCHRLPPTSTSTISS